jgi:inosine-uridine nucleoside N-ribohydrolase
MGVDDGLALVVASRTLGTAFRRVSTVFGNVPVEIATRNALIFRHLLGQRASFDLMVGAATGSHGGSGDARHVHGDDGLGGATARLDGRLLQQIEHVAELPALATAAPPDPGEGRITLIGLGPATNLPALVEWYGRDRIDRIVLMAGCFFDRGNITPAAEFNAYADPAALQATLALGIPTTLVPLDVCRKVQLARTTVAAYLDTDRSPLMRLLVGAHMYYMDYYRGWEGIDGCFPHDSIAILAAWMAERFVSLRGRVTVGQSGDERGRTSLTLDDASSIDVVMGGDLKWVRELLQTLPGG